MSTHDPMTTPARRDAATGDTTMRTQEPTMTERTENEHVDAITKILDEIGKNVIPVGKIVRSSTTIGTCPADINYIRRHLDALAARLAAAEAERDAARSRAERWKRLGLAHDAYDDEKPDADQQGVLYEIDAAWADLEQHGDFTDGSDDASDGMMSLRDFAAQEGIDLDGTQP